MSERSMINEILLPHFEAGERVLWAGQPDRKGHSGVHYSLLLAGLTGGLFILLSLMLSGRAAQHPVSEIAEGPDALSRLVLILALIFCGTISVTPLIRWRKALWTAYAITDRRIFEVRGGLFQPTLRQLTYDSIGWLEFEGAEDGHGEIGFLLRTSAGGRGLRSPLRMKRIADAEKVRKIIEGRLADRGMQRIYDLMGPNYLELLLKGKGRGAARAEAVENSVPDSCEWIRNPRVGSTKG